MKKNKCALIILFIIFCAPSRAQNLVINHSFEEYSTCPSRFNQLNLCKDWFSTGNGSSPEYFNACSKYNSHIGYSVGTPENLAGSQQPRTGNAYIGIVLLSPEDRKDMRKDDFYYREYVQGTLIDSLKKGQEYTFSFYISLAEYSKFYADRISVGFTKEQKISSKVPYSVLDCKNVVTIKGIDFTNSIDWIEVNGSYVASGRERFITIGLFLGDLTKAEFENIRKSKRVKNGKKRTYYYIDDVSLLPFNTKGNFSHQTERKN